MTYTITSEQQNAIREFLKDKHIPTGLGTEDEACSIASINLALTGRLIDDIPQCMSSVIGKWIIKVQDVMPDSMRNSDGWRNLIPLAAGTGRNNEGVRSQIILDWMWETVLPYIQDVADKYDFGREWKKMTTEKTAYAAYAAADAADAADAGYAAGAYAAAAAGYAATAAAYAADAAAYAYAADAARTATAAAHAADAAADAADAWRIFDPIGLLAKLVDVGSEK